MLVGTVVVVVGGTVVVVGEHPQAAGQPDQPSGARSVCPAGTITTVDCIVMGTC